MAEFMAPPSEADALRYCSQRVPITAARERLRTAASVFLQQDLIDYSPPTFAPVLEVVLNPLTLYPLTTLSRQNVCNRFDIESPGIDGGLTDVV